jgi:hypothetical protein
MSVSRACSGSGRSSNSFSNKFFLKILCYHQIQFSLLIFFYLLIIIEITSDSQQNEDPIKKSIGELGKWQIFVCGVVFLLKFPVAWHQMGIIFLAPKPEFHCIDEEIEKCSSNCTQHVFDKSVFQNTIIMEWDLVCDRQGLRGFSQTIFMLGILVGNMVIGGLADKYGRRLPLCFAVTTQLIFGVLSSYTTNFWLFSACRFMTAFATGGTMVTS